MRLDFGVKALIFNQEGCFLAMHKRNQKSPLLELPGGRINFGESIEEALVREIQEETALLVRPKKVLGTWDYRKRTGDFQVVGLIYEVEVDDVSSLLLSEEHDSYQWVSFTELEKLVPHFRSSLADYIEQ